MTYRDDAYEIASACCCCGGMFERTEVCSICGENVCYECHILCSETNYSVVCKKCHVKAHTAFNVLVHEVRNSA